MIVINMVILQIVSQEAHEGEKCKHTKPVRKSSRVSTNPILSWSSTMIQHSHTYSRVLLYAQRKIQKREWMADRNIVVCTTSPIGGALPHRSERRTHTLRYMPWPMSKMHRLGGTFDLLEIKWGSFPLKNRKKYIWIKKAWNWQNRPSGCESAEREISVAKFVNTLPKDA